MKYLLLLPIAFFATIASAQDVAIQSVTPNDDSRLKGGADQNFSILLDVNETVNAGATIALEYAWNEDALQALGNPGTINAQVPQGNTFTLNGAVPVPESAKDSQKLTLNVVLNGETKTDDNQIELMYYLSDTVNKDLEISIISPAEGSEVRNWTNVNFQVQIKNVGLETFPNGSTFITTILVNGQAQGNPDIATYTGADLEPGDSAVRSVDLTFPRNFPTGSAIQLCLPHFWAAIDGQTATVDEGYNENNAGCISLNVVANSINETQFDLNTVFYQGGNLNIQLFNKTANRDFTFNVVGLDGRIVASTGRSFLSESMQEVDMPLSNVNSGVYILQIYSNDEFVGSKKFFVD